MGDSVERMKLASVRRTEHTKTEYVYVPVRDVKESAIEGMQNLTRAGAWIAWEGALQLGPLLGGCVEWLLLAAGWALFHSTAGVAYVVRESADGLLKLQAEYIQARRPDMANAEWILNAVQDVPALPAGDEPQVKRLRADNGSER